MAKGDVLVRMKADVSNYDANIAKARGTLERFKQENLTMGGILNQSTKSIVAAAAQYASFAAVLGTVASGFAEAASKGIEMSREAEGVEAAFKRLNQPGLLENLRQATHNTVNDLELMKQAVKFDNFNLSLEQMGSFLAFAQQQAKDTGQDVNTLVDSIVLGLGRKSLPILDNLGLSAEEIRNRMKETGDMTKAVAEIIEERMAAAGDYVETAAERAAQGQTALENAMKKLGDTMNSLSGSGATLWNELEVGAINLANSAIKPLISLFNELAGYIQGTSVEDIITSGLDDVTDTVDDNGKLIRKNAIASIPEIVVSGNRPKTPKGGENGPTQEEIAAKIAAQWNKTSLKAGNGADALKGSDIKESMSVWAMMSDETKKSMLGLVDAIEDLGDAQAKLGDQKVAQELQGRIEAQNKALEEQAMRYNLAGQAASNFGAALAGLDDPAAKAAGTVIQAISSIALGFAMASSNANTAGTGWGWLAWLAAGTAAMATTISTIHSLTGYAEGGIVKGNHYSGDMLDGGSFGINAGELVLNKAQQGALANELSNGGMRTLHVVGKISGTDIILSADRSLRLQGKELAVWGRG